MYSQFHIDFLKELNFHLEKEGDRFYSDHKCSGRDYKLVYYTDSKWVLYSYTKIDGEGIEDYEYFDNLKELKSYLT